LERFVIGEQLLAHGAPVAAHWGTDRQVGPMILRHGSDKLRRQFIPEMARGELFVGTGLSEPASGSDLASLATRATKVENGYRLSGQKTWVTHADKAHYIIVLCRTTVESDKRRGLTELIVAATAPGLDIRPIEKMSGDRSFSDVFLDDVFVPDDMVLGTPGDGWRQITEELTLERMGPERYMSTAVLLLRLVRHLASVSASSADQLGELLSRFSALRNRAILAMIGRHRAPVSAEVSAAFKIAGTRFEQDVVEVARHLRLVEPDIAGDDEVTRLLREGILASPTFTLRGGTSEILTGVLSRGLGLR
jgi:alkylation response protein AidB-like acyl-CoA dehydrogenase